MYDIDSEARRVKRAQRGDKEAFTSLYDELFPGVYGFARSRLANDQQAEDVTSRTFLAVLKGLDSFQWRAPGSFRAWVFRILRNQIANVYRHNGHAQELEFNDRSQDKADPHSPNPESAIDIDEDKALIERALAELSPRQQEIVQLRYFGGLQNKEIALMLAIEERTVSAYLSRALKGMRQKLGLMEVLHHDE